MAVPVAVRCVLVIGQRRGARIVHRVLILKRQVRGVRALAWRKLWNRSLGALVAAHSALGAVLVPPTTAPPADNAYDDENGGEAAGEDVRPSAEDHLLVLLLFLLFRDGRVLHLRGGEELPLGVSSGVRAAEADGDKVAVRLIDVCYGEKLDVRIVGVVVAAGPTAKVEFGVHVPYCEQREHTIRKEERTYRNSFP